MSILSYGDRQKHWEWCREYIDREAVYRHDSNHPKIPAKAQGQEYSWQFYFRRATYNPQFSHRISLLFWDHFYPVYKQQPFQVCAVQPSGPPIGSAIQLGATALKLPLTLFSVRREPKHFGMDNWFEGRIRSDLPVLLVDDAAASTEYMREASARIRFKLKLPLHRNYFVIANKVGRGFSKQSQHTENYLDNELVALFTMNNFCKSAEEFKSRYGCDPTWTGITK